MINKTPYQHLIDRAVSLYNSKPGMPSLDFQSLPITFEMNSRMRTTGGLCRILPVSRTSRIELNTQLFATISEDERANIIAHELAHAACFFAGYVKEHHGARWVWIARAMGDSGERCHTLKVKSNLVKRRIYAHKSKGTIYSLSSQKAAKLSFSVRDVLSFVGEVTVDRNTCTYRWDRLIYDDLKDVKIFKGDFKLAH